MTTPAPTPITLDADTLDFLDATPRRFGTIATINPDGTPLLAVIWYAPMEDGRILVNSREGRRWPDNLLRDPRCSLIVGEAMEWVAVRGVAEVLDGGRPRGVADIVALAVRYGGDGPDLEERVADFRTQERISFGIRLTGVTVHR